MLWLLLLRSCLHSLCNGRRFSLFQRLVKLALCLLDFQKLARVRSDNLVFRVGRDYLDGRVLVAREENALAHTALKKQISLPLREEKHFRYRVNGRGRLAQKYLEPGIIHDSLPIG